MSSIEDALKLELMAREKGLVAGVLHAWAAERSHGARGYHDWFMKEIEEDRVLWPEIGVPA